MASLPNTKTLSLSFLFSVLLLFMHLHGSNARDMKVDQELQKQTEASSTFKDDSDQYLTGYIHSQKDQKEEGKAYITSYGDSKSKAYITAYGGSTRENQPYITSYSDGKRSNQPYITGYIHSKKESQPYITSYGDGKRLNRPYIAGYIHSKKENQPYSTQYGNGKREDRSYLTGYIHNKRENQPYITGYIHSKREDQPYITQYGNGKREDRSYLTGYIHNKRQNQPYITGYIHSKKEDQPYTIQYGDDKKLNQPYITGYINSKRVNQAYIAGYINSKKMDQPYIIQYGDGKKDSKVSTKDSKDSYSASYKKADQDFYAATYGKDSKDSYAAAYAKDPKDSYAKDLKDSYAATYGKDKVDHTEAFKTGFFTLDDLYVGNKMPLKFLITDFSNFLTKKEADSVPFSTSQLSSVHQLFSINEDSSQAQAMRDTLDQCELPTLTGETKTCVSSLESMIDFVRSIIGPEAQLDVLTTTLPTPSSVPLQNFTILEISQDIYAPKWVACHPLPYPYAVFFCHFIGTGSKIFKVKLGSENGEQVSALGICHLDTSEWSADHILFKQLGMKPGDAPVCHFFPVKHLMWVPLSSKATM